MSADGDTPGGHEIVIIKRGGGDHEDGHHGGAWKIAFADLMTAMMAFFLVMWLLNASDKEKIQQIATYFNPMKLNSKRPTAKGVMEVQDTPKSNKQEKQGSADKPNKDKRAVDGKGDKKSFKGGGDGEKKDGRPDTSEEDLFNDPYGVLAKLALKATDGKEGGGAGKGPGMNSGAPSISNPFEPLADQAPLEKRDEPSLALNRSNPLDGIAEPNPDPEVKPGGVQNIPGPEAPDALEAAPAPQPQPAPGPKPVIAPKVDTTDQAHSLEGQIQAALEALSPENKPSISVTQTADGLLISLTDDFRFGMFNTGESVPRPELVVVMEKIGKLLAERQGDIVVRGHTDARPFKGQKNNNWKLSMDRAQMAYYMLMRGGITEKRFIKIEGYADRELKVPSNPNAAENRRIEILLKVPKAG